MNRFLRFSIVILLICAFTVVPSHPASRHCGGGGEGGLDSEEHPGGGVGIDAEDAEDSGHQQRIERRQPGRGSGVREEGVGDQVPTNPIAPPPPRR